MKLVFIITHRRRNNNQSSDQKEEHALKKAKTVPSTGKVMATVLRGSKGILLIDYLGKGKRLTGVYHTLLLVNLNGEIASKRPHKEEENVVSPKQCAHSHLGCRNGKN